jgi:outer membrane lipoprotein carrier protein
MLKSVSRFMAASVLALICIGHACAADDTVKKITAAVDARYNSLQSFRADFVEAYSGNGVSRRESGTLSLKRPGKMRWDYLQPTQKLFISDGKIAVFYIPGERQARKTAVKNLDDFRSPLRYLLGKTRLEREFDDLSIADAATAKTPGNIILSGIPKNMAGRVQRVLLEITPQSQIQRIVVEEVDGATTEFTFSSITENLALAEAQFHFIAPPGVETIEATDLGGD